MIPHDSSCDKIKRKRMSERILITGITGFAGSHLAEYLLKRSDLEIHGIQRWRSKTENIDPLKGRIPIETTLQNLLDYWRRKITATTQEFSLT